MCLLLGYYWINATSEQDTSKSFSSILCYWSDILILYTNVTALSSVSIVLAQCREMLFFTFVPSAYGNSFRELNSHSLKSFYKAFWCTQGCCSFFSLFLYSSSKFCTLVCAKIECTHVKMTPGGAEKGKFKNKEQIHIPSNIWYTNRLPLDFSFWT